MMWVEKVKIVIWMVGLKHKYLMNITNHCPTFLHIIKSTNYVQNDVE